MKLACVFKTQSAVFGKNVKPNRHYKTIKSVSSAPIFIKPNITNHLTIMKILIGKTLCIDCCDNKSVQSCTCNNALFTIQNLYLSVHASIKILR